MPHSKKPSRNGEIVSNSLDTIDATRQDVAGYPTAEQPADSMVDDLPTAISNTNILLVIPVFLVGIFRYTTLNVLIQYASVRFGLKISTGATFYTETALVNIILFLFAIPRLTDYLRKEYQVCPAVMDLMMVRTSVLFMCLGSLAIGLTPSSTLLPLGTIEFPPPVEVGRAFRLLMLLKAFSSLLLGSGVEFQHSHSYHIGFRMMPRQLYMLQSRSWKALAMPLVIRRCYIYLLRL